MSNKRKRGDDSLNTVEELRERCAELRCSNSVRFMAIKCNLMVVRSIKRILGMELVSDDEKIGLMRTLFYSLESDPSVLPTRK
jgi:hypothetical protein